MPDDNTLFILAGRSGKNESGTYYGYVFPFDVDAQLFRDKLRVDLGDGDTYWDALTIGYAGDNRAIVVTEGEPHSAWLYDLATWTRGDPLELPGCYELNRQSVYDPVDDCWYWTNYDFYSDPSALVVVKVDVGAWAVETLRYDSYGISNWYPQGNGIALDRDSGYLFVLGYDESGSGNPVKLIRVDLATFTFVDEFSVEDYVSDIANYYGPVTALMGMRMRDGALYAVGDVRITTGGVDSRAPLVLKIDPTDCSLVSRWVCTDTDTISGTTYYRNSLIEIDFDGDGNVYSCGWARVSSDTPSYHIVSGQVYKLDSDLTYIGEASLTGDAITGWLQPMLVVGDKVYVATCADSRYVAGAWTNHYLYVIDCATLAWDAPIAILESNRTDTATQWAMTEVVLGYHSWVAALARRNVYININMRRR